MVPWLLCLACCANDLRKEHKKKKKQQRKQQQQQQQQHKKSKSRSSCCCCCCGGGDSDNEKDAPAVPARPDQMPASKGGPNGPVSRPPAGVVGHGPGGGGGGGGSNRRLLEDPDMQRRMAGKLTREAVETGARRKLPPPLVKPAAQLAGNGAEYAVGQVQQHLQNRAARQQQQQQGFDSVPGPA